MRYGRPVRNAIGLLAVLAMLLGPLLAHVEVVPPLAGFGMFALGVNFLRVLTLCVLNATSERAFELVHVYVWPAFISLVCLATLLLWIKSVQPEHA